MSKWSSEDVVKFLDVYEKYEGLWNIWHSDYSNKIKHDSAMLKLMGKVLKRNVAVESVEVLRKKVKSIKNLYWQELTKIEKKMEQQLMMFVNLNLHGLRGPIFSLKVMYQVAQLHRILLSTFVLLHNFSYFYYIHL